MNKTLSVDERSMDLHRQIARKYGKVRSSKLYVAAVRQLWDGLEKGNFRLLKYVKHDFK